MAKTRVKAKVKVRKTKEIKGGSLKLPTKSTTGKVQLSRIRMLIYSDPKVGKTTLLSGFPNTILVATEKGYDALKVFPFPVKKWEDFQDFVKLILRGDHEFKTIGIDTVDLLFKYCSDYVCKELGISYPGDEDYGKGWAAVRDEFEAEINKLFMSNYGLIFTSHTKIQNLSTLSGTSTKIQPTLANQGRSILIPKVSVIGYMKIKTVKKGDNKFVERRVINFKPSELVEAGDRDGKLPTELRVFKDPEKTYQSFKEHYDS